VHTKEHLRWRRETADAASGSRREVLVQKLLAVVLLLTMVAFGKDSAKAPPHPDYVPDEKTAVQIAEAVLVAQFGQERVNAQSPLRAVSTSKDAWLVQGTVRGLHGPVGILVSGSTSTQPALL